jgi:class 3 adenylate cyclase
MTPRALLALLNEFFAEVVDVILANEGTIFKLVGDSIMAVFGAPAPVSDPELRAVRCALAIQVVAGNVGSAKRVGYTVVGPAVSTAARIEELARRGQVLVADGTYRRIAERLTAVALGPKPLRGLGEVNLYEVSGLVLD